MGVSAGFKLTRSSGKYKAGNAFERSATVNLFAESFGEARMFVGSAH